MVGLNRQLPVATIQKDRQSNGPWTTNVGEAVEGGPDGSAGEEHVVDQDDELVIDGEGDFGLPHERLRSDLGQIVSVEGDVESADRNRRTFDVLDLLREPSGQRDATSPDPDEHQIVCALGLLDDLGGHPDDGTFDLGRIHDAVVSLRHSGQGCYQMGAQPVPSEVRCARLRSCGCWRRGYSPCTLR